MELIQNILIFIVGLCLGSFLNVVIYRLPLPNVTIWHPKRSACPCCGRTIAWYDNLPIVSYAALRGRCRHCGLGISFRYPFVEFLCGVLTLAVFMKNGPDFRFLAELYFVLALVAITYIDLDHTLIPDVLTFSGMILGLAAAIIAPDPILAGDWFSFQLAALAGKGAGTLAVFWTALALLFGCAVIWIVDRFYCLAKERESFEAPLEPVEPEVVRLREVVLEFFGKRVLWGWVVWIVLAVAAGLVISNIDPKTAQTLLRPPLFSGGWPMSLAGSVAGLVLGGGLIFIIYAVYLAIRGHEGMGLGDLTLLAMIGANLGWRSIILATIIGAFTALFAYLVTVAFGRSFNMKTVLPFGPFLSLGALIFMFFGESILTWYWNMGMKM